MHGMGRSLEGSTKEEERSFFGGSGKERGWRMASVMARDWAMEGSTVSGSAPTSVPPVAIIISRMSTLNNAHPLIRCASFGTAGQDQGRRV